MDHFLVIPSKLENVENARIFLGEIFQIYRLNRSSFNKVFLGLSEAVTNSILHGNKSDESKKVKIKISYHENVLIVEIGDEGDGFPPDNIVDPLDTDNIKKENGRGIFLISSFADELTFLDGGKKVVIKYSVRNEHNFL